MKLKTIEQIEDFVRGCTFYGTGGGGDYALGVEALRAQLEKGHEIGWVDASELPDDAYTCCPFLMGSIAPLTAETVQEMKEVYDLDEPMYDYTGQLATSVLALERVSGKKIAALVPIELGGANAAACLAAAAENGMFALDGDYTGRAIPEIQQTTPFIYEKELMPITSTDAWGNTAILESAKNWRIAERLGKFLSAAAYTGSGQAGFLMSAAETKEILMHGTMTECYEIGKLIRESAAAGLDVPEVLADKLTGWVLCRGTVTKKEWWDEAGYYWGYHTITGSGESVGTELKIWFKNENHISWKNGEVFITSPDMLQVIDSKTYEPYTNNKIEEGMDVTVIGLRARGIFRSERGLLTLGPKAFGFDLPYVPVEELMD